jgi:hypothetical protein
MDYIPIWHVLHAWWGRSYGQQFQAGETATVPGVWMTIAAKNLGPYVIRATLSEANPDTGLVGTNLAQSLDVWYNEVAPPLTDTPTPFYFTFTEPTIISAGEWYWIVLTASYPDGVPYPDSNEIRWYYTEPANLPQGEVVEPGIWVFVDPPAGTMLFNLDLPVGGDLTASLADLALSSDGAATTEEQIDGSLDVPIEALTGAGEGSVAVAGESTNNLVIGLSSSGDNEQEDLTGKPFYLPVLPPWHRPSGPEAQIVFPRKRAQLRLPATEAPSTPAPPAGGAASYVEMKDAVTGEKVRLSIKDGQISIS